MSREQSRIARAVAAAVTTLLSAIPVHAQVSKARVVIVATGGTIAGAGTSTTASGYAAATVPVEMLIAAVPQLKNFADVRGVQVSSIGSQDMNDQLWVKLAVEVSRLLDGRDGVFPEPRPQERQARGHDGIDAAVHVAER
jgi:L-asparaginase/Glu-tRNA(Gln) amidotransferase subunit D